jgi:hypothetical protein
LYNILINNARQQSQGWLRAAPPRLLPLSFIQTSRELVAALSGAVVEIGFRGHWPEVASVTFALNSAADAFGGTTSLRSRTFARDHELGLWAAGPQYNWPITPRNGRPLCR